MTDLDVQDVRNLVAKAAQQNQENEQNLSKSKVGDEQLLPEEPRE